MAQQAGKVSRAQVGLGLRRAGRTVATVSKRWFSWRDTYGIDIDDDEDQILLLACAVVVDEACHPDDGKRH